MQVRSIPRPFIRTPRLAGLAAAAWLAAALAGCASSSTPARDWTQQLQRWSDAPLVLLGEQHDAAAHQAWQQATVQQLATQERLAALVIEMAPRTGSTASLARDASEDAVQQALQ
jgi:Haem-binding uptake, Tiki superfamily, ChaN